MKFCINLNFLEENSTKQFLSVTSSLDNDNYCCLDLYISPNSSLEEVVSRENILKLSNEKIEDIEVSPVEFLEILKEDLEGKISISKAIIGDFELNCIELQNNLVL